MNQPQVHVCPLPAERPSHLTPLGCCGAQGWAPCITQRIPTSCLFLQTVVYVFPCSSHVAPPSPSHTVSPGLFSMSASPWLPCKQAHQYHLKAAVSWGSGARTFPTEQQDRAFWTEASSTPWELVECGATGDMDKPWSHAGNVRKLLSGWEQLGP